MSGQIFEKDGGGEYLRLVGACGLVLLLDCLDPLLGELVNLFLYKHCGILSLG